MSFHFDALCHVPGVPKRFDDRCIYSMLLYVERLLQVRHCRGANLLPRNTEQYYCCNAISFCLPKRYIPEKRLHTCVPKSLGIEASEVEQRFLSVFFYILWSSPSRLRRCSSRVSARTTRRKTHIKIGKSFQERLTSYKRTASE